MSGSHYGMDQADFHVMKIKGADFMP